mgnify:CR=1 FL=1
MEKFKKILKEYLPYVIIIILVLVIKSNITSLIKVNGRSMNNTLKDGDIMILDIIGYKTSKLKRFEIIVIDTKKDYSLQKEENLRLQGYSLYDEELYIDGNGNINTSIDYVVENITNETNVINSRLEKYGENIAEKLKVRTDSKRKYIVNIIGEITIT